MKLYGTPLPTTGPTGLVASVVAAPNILRDWEPIKFLVNLTKPARLSLALYTLAREKAYIAEMQGAAGLNTLIWELQNYASQPAAGVLYIYVLQTDGGNQTEKRIGKVVVIR